MSNTETSGTTEPMPEARSGASDHPVFEAGWKDRLSEARAKRDRVLSLRRRGKNADLSPEPSLPEETAPSERREDDAQAGFWLRMLHANALILMLVFFGAAGLGLGVTLGFGALTGLAASREAAFGTPDTALSVQPEKIVTVVSPSPEPATVAQPTATDTIIPDPASAPELLDAPMPVVVPTVMRLDDISLPAISAVEYMRADMDPAAALGLRSLPDVSASGAEEMAYRDLTTDRLQFFVHAPDGIPNGALQAYVSRLKDAGVSVAAIGRESFRVSVTHLRYYSPQNAAAAQNIAGDLGVEARDFSQNATNTERIEVWLAGRPKPVEEIEEPQAGFFVRLFNSQKVASEELVQSD